MLVGIANRKREFCRTLPFAPFLRQAQILILEILNGFRWLKFSPFLNLNEIKHFSKGSKTSYIVDDINPKFEELIEAGYECSQILVAMGLHNQGKTNWDLIRSVEGLKGGLGYSGKLCGALAGGACFLGLYAGRGPEEEAADSELDSMILELVEWFEDIIGKEYGGIDCDQITASCLDNEELSLTCVPIVIKVYNKLIEILKSHGLDMSKGRG